MSDAGWLAFDFQKSRKKLSRLKIKGEKKGLGEGRYKTQVQKKRGSNMKICYPTSLFF